MRLPASEMISMMAGSTSSNRRPNTLTQDRNNQRRPKPLEDRGNVGIIRSPLRASILPDYIGSPDAAGYTQLR